MSNTFLDWKQLDSYNSKEFLIEMRFLIDHRNDLFLYFYERDFMDSLNHDNEADVIEAFNSASRYLDDLLNIDNPHFEGMVNEIHPRELQLIKANNTGTKALFLDLHLSIANGFVSSNIYYKRDDFDFDIVNFPFFGW